MHFFLYLCSIIHINIEMSQINLLPEQHTLQMGKYRVEKQLASGGFGNTYEVTNVHFDERYAMKEFFMKGINEREGDTMSVSVSNRDNSGQFNSQLEKFKKEARRLRKLHNQHIVQVHDLFEENNTAYYVMDYVDGESLSKRMKRSGKPMDEYEVLNILSQMLDALEVVHEKGIWHLDIKPGNIMVDKKGNAVLIDFGASKQLSANEGYTTTGTAMCFTPGYAPPEQVDQKMELIGPWTDLYALGATLYHLLSKRQPPTVAEMGPGAFVYPHAVSDKTQYLIRWMMRPNRQFRPQSVAQVREFLAKPFDLQQMAKEEEEVETQYGGDKHHEEEVMEEGFNLSDWVSDHQPILYSVLGIFVVFVVILYFSMSGKKAAVDEIPDQQADALLSELVNKDEPNTVKSLYFKSALGVCAYTGPVDDDGNPHGMGEASFTDGRLYKGPFEHGNFDGDHAYFRYENGDTFEGTFINNAFSKGRYTIKEDGTYFYGSFTKGQPDKGKWYNKNGKEL